MADTSQNRIKTSGQVAAALAGQGDCNAAVEACLKAVLEGLLADGTTARADGTDKYGGRYGIGEQLTCQVGLLIGVCRA